MAARMPPNRRGILQDRWFDLMQMKRWAAIRCSILFAIATRAGRWRRLNVLQLIIVWFLFEPRQAHQ